MDHPRLWADAINLHPLSARRHQLDDVLAGQPQAGEEAGEGELRMAAGRGVATSVAVAAADHRPGVLVEIEVEPGQHDSALGGARHRCSDGLVAPAWSTGGSWWSWS